MEVRGVGRGGRSPSFEVWVTLSGMYAATYAGPPPYTRHEWQWQSGAMACGATGNVKTKERKDLDM